MQIMFKFSSVHRESRDIIPISISKISAALGLLHFYLFRKCDAMMSCAKIVFVWIFTCARNNPIIANTPEHMSRSVGVLTFPLFAPCFKCSMQEGSLMMATEILPKRLYEKELRKRYERVFSVLSPFYLHLVETSFIIV